VLVVIGMAGMEDSGITTLVVAGSIAVPVPVPVPGIGRDPLPGMGNGAEGLGITGNPLAEGLGIPGTELIVGMTAVPVPAGRVLLPGTGKEGFDGRGSTGTVVGKKEVTGLVPVPMMLLEFAGAGNAGIELSGTGAVGRPPWGRLPVRVRVCEVLSVETMLLV
jgi:hypothetical protein